MDVFVVGDELGSPWLLHVTGTADDVAERGGKALPWHKASAIHVPVASLAQPGNVARIPLDEPDGMREETRTGHWKGPRGVEGERDKTVGAAPTVDLAIARDCSVQPTDDSSKDADTDGRADSTCEHSPERGSTRRLGETTGAAVEH